MPRVFETTLLGILYEICQVYPVYLLSEKLDGKTEKLLLDKKLFPSIKEIIPISPPKNIFSQNIYFYRLAKSVIKSHLAAVVLPSDMYPLFELYVMRMAKRKGLLKIAIQCLLVPKSKEVARWIDLMNACLRFSSFLPLSLRIFLARTGKYVRHIAYYFALPLLIGQVPFFGRSSFILKRGISGMRDTDYQTALSERDYDIHIEEGVPKKKLYILRHPLTRQGTRELFKKLNFNKTKVKENMILVFLSSEIKIGFKKGDFSFITFEERKKIWLRNIEDIKGVFPEHKIIIKPHPNTDNLEEIKTLFENLGNNVKVLPLETPVNRYILSAQLVIGLPLSASTALFLAVLHCPEKPILSLDLARELYGDFYRNFDGIEYIDDESEFIGILNLIKSSVYKKKKIAVQNLKSDHREFKNSVEMLTVLLGNDNP